MTPERIEHIKEQIKLMDDRELQNAILLKLTQIHEEQIESTAHTKRAGDNARYLFLFFFLLFLVAFFLYISMLEKMGVM